VHHDHDAAHRLVGVSDSLGNRITYTLDNMGNRTAEWVTDPAGTLRRSVQRGIDALGRVQRLTGREMGP
jgi:YD repeat-containing protein